MEMHFTNLFVGYLNVKMVCKNSATTNSLQLLNYSHLIFSGLKKSITVLIYACRKFKNSGFMLKRKVNPE